MYCRNFISNIDGGMAHWGRGEGLGLKHHYEVFGGPLEDLKQIFKHVIELLGTELKLLVMALKFSTAKCNTQSSY